MTLLRASWVLPVAGPPIRDGLVAVRDGRVAWVGAVEDARRPSGEVRDLGPGVLMPGLVNAHCHLELSHLAGQVDGSRGFVGWVRELVARRGGTAPEAIRACAAAAIRALVDGGTVAVGDVSNGLAHVDLLAESDLRAVVFFELIGWDPSAAGAVLAAADARLASLPADLAARGVRVALAAHAPHSVSPALFEGLVRRGGPAALHLAESPAERRFLASGDGDWRAFLAERGLGHVSFEPSGTSPVAYVDALGALRPRPLAAHCVQVDDSDLALLARRGVPVAVCPRSNQALGVGLPPVPKMLEAGIDVCLGTDSLASAPTLDLLDDLRALHAGFPGIEPSRLIEMATAAGARALGLDDLGTIEPGKRAALAFVASEGTVGDPCELVVSGNGRAARVET